MGRRAINFRAPRDVGRSSRTGKHLGKTTMGKWFTTRRGDRTYRLDMARVGLIAGWGRYPVLIAETLKKQGQRVSCVAVRDHADPVLAELCDDITWVNIARLGKAVRFLQSEGVRRATMAGKIHKVRLFDSWRLFRYFPDLTTFRMICRIAGQNWKDDTLLLGVVDLFARGGVSLVPATDFAPELLVKKGVLTARRPSVAQLRDIQFGWDLAREMGRLDVGQCVAVKDRAVLAVEAIEGTDACIRRAGTLCRQGGFTTVKVAKPQQDMRFDVPTIGLGTLETMVAAGGRVLAIEAGRTIILDEPDVVRYANRHGLVIVARDPIDEPRTILSTQQSS